MHSSCFSSTLIGVEAHLVTVESVVTSGLPGLTLVGLPDAAVSEAGARVRAALKLSGFSLPPRRIVVSLSPADLRKTGSGFDLALALGLLEALGELPSGCLRGALIVGELALNGALRSVRGLVPSMALAHQHCQIEKILLPLEQRDVACLWDGLEVVPVADLNQAVAYFRGEYRPLPVPVCQPPAPKIAKDLCQVQGQELAKLALEVTAAGGHHLAMVGPPGCGKSLLASCLPGLFPPLNSKEQQEVASIASVCLEDSLPWCRPFRAPGVSLSAVALLGGYQPGEVTRAHQGVLFLDEFLEYRRDTLEALRLVLEEGIVKVARAKYSAIYPADFTLVCAMNPCPCGNWGSKSQECICSPRRLESYRSKLSGPLMDRLDLFVGLNRVPLDSIWQTSVSQESSQEVAQRVGKAREFQRQRGTLNSRLQGPRLIESLRWSASEENFVSATAERAQLSLRALEKWLRVSRTLADLDQSETVSPKNSAA